MKKYLQLLRVKHYIKNLFVFTALFCSGQLLDWAKLGKAAIAFAAFSLVTSAIYIINDIRDREHDLNHPDKRERPIAAGTVSLKSANILVVALMAAGIICNCLIYSLVPTLLLIMYILINVSYSHGGKHVPLLDLSFLAAGYMIRVVYGSLALGIPVSNWMYLMMFTQAFFLALGKRRIALKHAPQTADGEQADYPARFMNGAPVMCMTLTNVFFALWALNEKTKALFPSKYMIVLIPVFLLVSLKYDLVLENAPDGDPVEVLLHDKVLLVMFLVLLAAMTVVMYVL